MLWGDARTTLVRRPAVRGTAIGLAGAVLGLLPWIVTGMRLPLQNLWASPVASPSAMPFALLPFSQYAITLIASLVLIGAAATGLTLRLLRRRLVRADRWWALGALVAVQIGCVVETTAVTAPGLRTDPTPGTGPSSVYLAALVTGSCVAIALGVAVFLAIAVWPAPVSIVAFAVVSVAFGAWCDQLVAPFDAAVDPGRGAVLGVTRWVPAVVVAAAVAVAGLRTAGRIIGSAIAVAVLWVETAAATALTNAMSTRALLPYPRELADYALDVFRAASGPAGTGLGLAVVAAVLGAVGAAVVAVISRRRPGRRPPGRRRPGRRRPFGGAAS